MKKTLLSCAILLGLTALTTSHAATDLEKVSYALGYELVQQTPAELNLASFIQGIEAGHSKQTSRYSQAEIEAAYETVSAMLESKMAAQAVQNAATGEEFLKQNAKKSGVKTTASGLQYKTTVVGKGKRPTADSTVTVHYTGRLVDGQVFDSSVERGEPIEFALNQVIEGWTEGVQLMKEGGKTTLYVPAKLGYAEQGVEGNIPPNSVLIFDIELLKVQ